MKNPLDKGPSEEDLLRERENFEKFKGYEGLGEIILGNLAFRIRISYDVKTLAFSHENREILINPNFVEEKKLDDPERMYVFCHEISHIVQLFQDPNGYIETFDIAKEEGEKNPDNKKAVEKSWNRYFNSFMDIHGNATHEGRMPSFRGRRNPRQTLYGEKLFPSTDLTEYPRNLQFCYSVLRRTMVPDEEIKLSPVVEKKLREPISYLGKRYQSFQDFVNKELFDGSIKLQDFLFRLKRVAEPIFRELLEEDLNEGNLGLPEEAFNIVDVDEGMVSEKVARGIAEKINRAKQGTNSRVNDQMGNDFERKMQSAGFDDREIRRMTEIMNSVENVFRQLEDLWSIFSKVFFQKEQIREGGYRTGSEISLDDFVRKFPEFIVKPTDAPIFSRKHSVEREKGIMPKKIHLFLVLDLSGSMDQRKRRATQEAAYSLIKSLIRFRRNLLLEFDDEDEMNIDINLRVLGFGGTTMDLLEKNEEEIREGRVLDNDLDRRLWQSILEIEKVNLGVTKDALALREILNELETVAQTGDSLDVYPRAIRIEGPIYDENQNIFDRREGAPITIPESGTFKRVWGEKGKLLDELSKLRETMLSILFKALQDQEESPSDEVAVVIEITDGETSTPEESIELIKKLERLGEQDK